MSRSNAKTFLQLAPVMPALLPAALLLVAGQTQAQNPPTSSVPVLRSRVVVLGDAPRDLRGSAALSPNSRLIAYQIGFDAGLSIWNVATREHFALLTGPVHVHHWAPTGDAIVFQTHAGSLSYQGTELSREPSIWTIRIDSLTGKPLAAPRLVAEVGVNHGVHLSPDQRMIAFAQAQGSYVSSLAVVPTAGGVPRMLASGVEVAQIQWATDGASLYYSAHENALSRTRRRYRVPLTGGAAIPIGEDHPIPVEVADNVWDVSNPATGRRAAYTAFPEDVAVSDWDGIAPWRDRREIVGVRTSRPRGLRVVNLAERSFRDLIDTTGQVVAGPEWLPDNRIAVIVREDGRLVLRTLSLDGSTDRRFPLLHHRSAGELRIAPNGRYAAFRSTAGGFGTIQVMDLGSGREESVVSSAYDFGDGSGPEGMGLGAIAWGKDSERLLYLADIWTATPTVRERTLAGADKALLPLPRFIYGTGASFPSAPQPAYVQFAGARAVTLVPIDGSAPQVVYTQASIGGPLSPNGQLVAVQTRTPNDPGAIQVQLAATDGSAARSLPLSFGARPGIAWHPGGQQILVIGREKAGAPLSVYAVPVNGTAPVAVAPVGSPRDEATLAVSPDGRFLGVTVAGTPKATFVKLVYDWSGKLR